MPQLRVRRHDSAPSIAKGGVSTRSRQRALPKIASSSACAADVSAPSPAAHRKPKEHADTKDSWSDSASTNSSCSREFCVHDFFKASRADPYWVARSRKQYLRKGSASQLGRHCRSSALGSAAQACMHTSAQERIHEESLFCIESSSIPTRAWQMGNETQITSTRSTRILTCNSCRTRSSSTPTNTSSEKNELQAKSRKASTLRSKSPQPEPLAADSAGHSGVTLGTCDSMKNEMLTSPVLRLAQQTFQNYDQDCDGSLDSREFRTMLLDHGVTLESPHASCALALVASPGAGKLGFEGFKRLLAHDARKHRGYSAAGMRELRWLFMSYDRNDSGMLEPSEYTRLLEDIGHIQHCKEESQKLASHLASCREDGKLGPLKFDEFTKLIAVLECEDPDLINRCFAALKSLGSPPRWVKLHSSSS